MRRILLAVRAVVVALALLLAGSASAGSVIYDFSWSGGQSFTASGTLLLSDSVGVGSPFELADVVSFQLELFDGGSSVGTGSFPPFDETFHALEGTRQASSLDINDLIVTVPFGITFGCDAGDCLSGRVAFESFATTVDFGSRQAAQESFVFSEVPAPGRGVLLAAALATMAVIRPRKEPRDAVSVEDRNDFSRGSERGNHRAPRPRGRRGETRP